MSYYATQRLKAILDQIQALHEEARGISIANDIPFTLALQAASGYTDEHYFNPSDAQSTGWYSSNC